MIHVTSPTPFTTAQRVSARKPGGLPQLFLERPRGGSWGRSGRCSISRVQRRTAIPAHAYQLRATRAGPRRFEPGYWMALPTDEKTLLALEPINRIVPTTITRITASITAYSATSCPCSSCQILLNHFAIAALLGNYGSALLRFL